MFPSGLVASELLRRSSNRQFSRSRSLSGNSQQYLVLMELYQKLFNRRASRLELNPHLKKLSDGVPIKKISKNIMFSLEGYRNNDIPLKDFYFPLFNLLVCSKADFVNQVFLQVLKRRPSEVEGNIWARRFKFLPRIVVLLLFLRITEFKENSIQMVWCEAFFVKKYKIRRTLYMVLFSLKNLLLLFAKIVDPLGDYFLLKNTILATQKSVETLENARRCLQPLQNQIVSPRHGKQCSNDDATLLPKNNNDCVLIFDNFMLTTSIGGLVFLNQKMTIPLEKILVLNELDSPLPKSIIFNDKEYLLKVEEEHSPCYPEGDIEWLENTKYNVYLRGSKNENSCH